MMSSVLVPPAPFEWLPAGLCAACSAGSCEGPIEWAARAGAGPPGHGNPAGKDASSGLAACPRDGCRTPRPAAECLVAGSTAPPAGFPAAEGVSADFATPDGVH